MIRALQTYSNLMPVREILISLRDKIESMIWRRYTADCLRCISKNTANASGGKFIEKQFDEILKPNFAERKTAEEIVDDIIRRAGLEVIG